MTNWVAMFSKCFSFFLTLALNIHPFFSSSVHLRTSSPLPTFFTVLFERAVRYVLVLYFLVTFLVISLQNTFHLFFVLSNCNQLYCRKKSSVYKNYLKRIQQLLPSLATKVFLYRSSHNQRFLNMHLKDGITLVLEVKIYHQTMVLSR